MKHQNSHPDDRDPVETHLVTIDADTDEIVSEVALELEESLDTAGDELPPLNDSIDLELLIAMAGARESATPMVASVSFDYCDREVVIERSTLPEDPDPDQLVMTVKPKPRLPS